MEKPKIEIILKKEPKKFGGNAIIIFREWRGKFIETFCADGHQEICFDYFCQLRPIKPQECQDFLGRFRQIYHEFNVVLYKKIKKYEQENTGFL